MTCPHCASEQPADAVYCHICGRVTRTTGVAGGQPQPKSARRGRTVALVALAIVLLPVALIFGPVVSAVMLAVGLLLLFLVPVLIGTFAIALGAFAVTVLAVVVAFLAATAGVLGHVSINNTASKQLAEGMFERTLPVSDSADLFVKTRAGSIEVRTSDDMTVRVVATVRINGTATMTEAQAQEQLDRVVAAPPIERDGNTIRIGKGILPANVSISYVLNVPAKTRVHTQTSAGSIRAVGLAGKFTADTGAGNIDLLQASGAEIDVRTGAGNIKLSGAKLALLARTGAGNIEVEGAPAAGWRVQTSSGSITMRLPTTAAFQLKAKTSAGSITTAHKVATEGSVERNSLRGIVNGGGPQIDLSTTAGNIRLS